MDFVATGGYALRAYDRFARLVALDDGRLRLAHPRLAQQYRLNVGNHRRKPDDEGAPRRPRPRRARGLKSDGRPNSQRALMGGRVLGEVEEYFAEQLAPA